MLPRSFFERNAVDVAYDLIGKELILNSHRVQIIETEAYLGPEDPASHAYKGPTPRARIMFGPAGHFYVYLIYGMHYCMNIVAHESKQAGAVLIRGIKVGQQNILGPGRVCKYLNIDKNFNHLDITTHPHIYCLNTNIQPEIISTPRIGIKVGLDKAWRFIDKQMI